MITDGTLHGITDGDRDTEREVRVHEVIELQLPARPTTGHLWAAADQPDEIVLESWPRAHETPTDPYDTGESDAEVQRVWRIHTTEPGTFELRLKCWQPWEGEASIVNTYQVTIEAS